MARSKSNRRRRNKRGLMQTTAMVGAMILTPLIALGGGGYVAYQHLNTEQIDANYCYTRNDQEQVAVFVDFSHTKSSSASQMRDLRNRLDQAYDQMEPNGQISVFTTDGKTTATVSKPEFTICKPAKTAEEQDALDAPASSSTKLKRTYLEAEAQFEHLVQDMLVRSQTQGRLAKTSPILEQIQGISRYNFDAPLARLIIYSDGINNSPTARFCSQKGELPRFEVFAQRPAYQRVVPDGFFGAAIDFLMVEIGQLPQAGLEYCSNAELRAFWASYFEANGAGQVRVTPLSYGAGQ